METEMDLKMEIVQEKQINSKIDISMDIKIQLEEEMYFKINEIVF